MDAHTDRNNDNQPDLPRPQGSPSRVFDFTLDLTQAPTTYSNAAVVQLFYWNNFMHDKLYELGFTEAAGNFQSTNFGRGGLGNDAVQADAQDGGGYNNANFSTPPDGSRGPHADVYLQRPDPGPGRRLRRRGGPARIHPRPEQPAGRRRRGSQRLAVPGAWARAGRTSIRWRC